VEALGEMVGLVTRSQLKAALPRLIPTILDLYVYVLNIILLFCMNSSKICSMC
jgi:hypothetical protein